MERLRKRCGGAGSGAGWIAVPGLVLASAVVSLAGPAGASDLTGGRLASFRDAPGGDRDRAFFLFADDPALVGGLPDPAAAGSWVRILSDRTDTRAVALPASGWERRGARFVYRPPRGAPPPGGIDRILLEQRPGGGRLLLRARGAGYGAAPRRRPVSGPVGFVQLELGLGDRILRGRFAAPAAEPRVNRPDRVRFRARGALPPPPPSTLREAAARVGLRIGMHLERRDAASIEILLRESNATTNHGLTTTQLMPRPGQFRFGPADAAQDLARAQGLFTHGFHWIWDQEVLTGTPDWLLGIAERTELLAVLREVLRTIFARYPDLDRINVVNEPLETLGGSLHRNHFHRVLGADYVAEVFALAAEVRAETGARTELFVNENLVEYLPDKGDAYRALVADLVARGIPIDGVGFQAHFLLGEPDWVRFEALMREVDALGLAVSITELDVPVAPDLPDRRSVQAERYRRAVELCLEVPACDSIIVWGVHDGATWLDGLLGPGTDPLLFDAELQPKPAWGAFLEALNRAAGSGGS